MNNGKRKIPAMLRNLNVKGIIRIDAGMEGDWSSSVVTIWNREEGYRGLSGFSGSHPDHCPSLELYFRGAWVGAHCFRRVGRENVFDEEFNHQDDSYREFRDEPSTGPYYPEMTLLGQISLNFN